jgi:lipid-A-disaccharide synthase
MSTDSLSVAPAVLIVAGEASSDRHAAGLVRALKKFRPELSLFGMGGTELRRAGVETVVDSEESGSAMGLSELGGNLKKTVSGFRCLAAEIKKRRPALAVLVDYPDFNLRLAKVLSREKVKVLYFIGPQLWAWRRGRIRQMKRFVDRVAVIFPFEEQFYRAHGMEADFVGHPFLDEPWPEVDRAAFFREIGLNPALPAVALLPGSRKPEVERLLPPMVEGFLRERRIRPGLQAIVPVAPGLSVDFLKQLAPEAPGLVFRSVSAREVLSVADAAVVASGTATVEAALSRTPFFVVYKFSSFTYRVARLLVRGVRSFAMVNLVAGRQIVPELLQREVTGERIAAEFERLLGDPVLRERLKRDFELVAKRLRSKRSDGSSAADRAARAALELMSASGSAPAGEVAPRQEAR